MQPSTQQYVRQNDDGTVTVVDGHVVQRMAMRALTEIEEIEKREGLQWDPTKERSIPRSERNKRAAARRVAKKARKKNGRR